MTGSQRLDWWATLANGDRELLRGTYDTVSGNHAAVVLLAGTKCPLTVGTQHPREPYRLTNARQVENFLAQM